MTPIQLLLLFINQMAKGIPIPSQDARCLVTLLDAPTLVAYADQLNQMLTYVGAVSTVSTPLGIFTNVIPGNAAMSIIFRSG
jgi:hypothetical protein